MSGTCYLCNSELLEALPAPSSAVSVTTDGQLVNAPWRKRQCLACGLVQAADTSPPVSYEEDYRFYDRPHMREFDVRRYSRYAAWVARYMEVGKPLRVLEIGCGAGWVLEGLRTLHPQCEYTGLEPSASACLLGRAAGLQVAKGSLLSEAIPFPVAQGGFDFIYSINVIEHVSDPVAFVHAASELLTEDGVLCTVCPNGSMVDPELLFSDHLFTFPSDALDAVLAQGGIKSMSASRGEAELGMFQAMCGVRAPKGAPHAIAPPPALLQARRDYMKAWQELDAVVCGRLAGAKRVLCFGAGEMSDALRAYAPGAWTTVGAHVIDRPGGALEPPAPMRGLPVLYLDELVDGTWDAVLLGTKPHYQPALFERLRILGMPVVRWDDAVAFHA
jgi:SAM-dependent methyltransferase